VTLDVMVKRETGEHVVMVLEACAAPATVSERDLQVRALRVMRIGTSNLLRREFGRRVDDERN
jgi:hypothetical protein